MQENHNVHCIVIILWRCYNKIEIKDTGLKCSTIKRPLDNPALFINISYQNFFLIVFLIK